MGTTTASRPLPRAERRDAILEGAAVAFARAGYAATSMEDIAAASGITKLIVYRHFDGKEQLYRAVLERVFSRQAHLFLEQVERGPQAGSAPVALLTVAREHPAGFQLLWRHAAREPQFAAYAQQLRGHAVAAAREVVEARAPSVPTAWASATLFDWLIDAVLNWLDHGSGEGGDDDFVRLTSSALQGAVAAWARAGTDGPASG